VSHFEWVVWVTHRHDPQFHRHIAGFRSLGQALAYAAEYSEYEERLAGGMPNWLYFVVEA